MKKQVYKTQEEAERNLPTAKALGFCPIIDHDCNRNCVCYKYPHASYRSIPGRAPGYITYEAYCSHVLVLGDISVELVSDI